MHRFPGAHVQVDRDPDTLLILASVITQDKPVAVAHTNFAGTSEVSSCNYLARKAGVTAGMWMGEAKRLCPQITVLMYDFEQYEEVSLRQMYPIFYQVSPAHSAPTPGSIASLGRISSV